MAHGDYNPIQAPSPTPSSQNFAPISPLQNLSNDGKSYERSSLVQIIREFHNETYNRYLDGRREIAETGRLMSNLRSGKLIMRRDPMFGNLALLKPLPNKPRNDRHVYPLAQVNSSQLTSLIALSQPKMTPRHFGNSNKSQIQHALIEKLCDHYDVEIYNEWFVQKESLSLMDYGTEVIRPFYDTHLNTIRQLQPIIENVDKTIFPGHGYCKNCLFDGTPDDFPEVAPGYRACPNCDSFNTSNMVMPQTATVAQIVGQKEICQGDVGGEMLPVPACNWDMRGLVQESSYFNYRSEVPIKLVRSILGVDVPESDPDFDYGLRVMNMLGTRGGAVEGEGRENLYGRETWRNGMTLIDEEYYKPEWYAGMTLQQDETTVTGDVIPANVPLEKIFTEGICAIGFADMSIVVAVHNERCRVKSGVYHIQSHSGIGKGTSDAVEASEQLNIAHSAALAQLKRFGAGGGVWYDKAVMTKNEAQALLKPDGLVGIKMRGTQYTSVDQAIRRLEYDKGGQENMAYVAQLSNLVNIVFQTTEFTTGVTNQKVDVNTLGGQQMLEAQNRQRSAAPLRLRGWTKTQVFEEIIDLARVSMVAPRFFGKADRFSLSQGRMISGNDLPEKVKLDYVEDSEVPSNTFTKRDNAERMLEKSQFFGPTGFVGLMQFSPRLAAWWVDQFPGVDIPLFSQTEILIVCQERLDRIKEEAQKVDMRSQLSGFYPVPQQAAQQIVMSLGVAMSEENHVVKAEVLKEYLDDDEVKEWSPLTMACVEALIQLHYQYDSDNRFRVPTLDQQQALKLQFEAAQATQAMTAPQVAADQNNALIQEGLSRVADEAAKEGDAERDEQSKDADLKRDEKVKQADHKRNLDLIKEKEKYVNNSRTGSASSGSNKPRPKSRPGGRK